MSWVNVGFIPTTSDWLYTQPFVGDYVRIKHVLTVDKQDLPYGFTGLIAQAFEFPGDVELFNVRQLNPFNDDDIYPLINPFPGRSRRLGIRVQRKFQSSISWGVSVDVWRGENNYNSHLLERINRIKATVNQIWLSISSNSSNNGDNHQSFPNQAQQDFFFLQ